MVFFEGRHIGCDVNKRNEVRENEITEITSKTIKFEYYKPLSNVL